MFNRTSRPLERMDKRGVGRPREQFVNYAYSLINSGLKTDDTLTAENHESGVGASKVE